VRWFVLLLLAGCPSRPDHSGDPAVGRWQGANGKVIELRADGSLDMDPVTTPTCDGNAELLRSCRARQRWSHSGTTVTLSRGAIADQPSSLGTAGHPCECRYENIQVQLHGDELVYGTEHAKRVSPKPKGDPAP
jgi:hypothetical protein